MGTHHVTVGYEGGTESSNVGWTLAPRTVPDSFNTAGNSFRPQVKKMLSLLFFGL